jgi:hypothetical protein
MLDASAVLRELDGMWRAAGKQEGTGVLRACAMTMLVVSPPDDEGRDAAEAIAGLTREHPSRLVLVRRHSGQGTPTARATVECWMPFGGRQQICSERIEMDAPPGALAELLPAIRGVLVPDLPVVLWLRDLALAGSAELNELRALAGKIIIDTGALREAREAWPVLDALRGGRALVADLAWTRVTRWRETLQQAFRLPACQQKLRAVEGIGIHWAGAGTPATVAYLAGWLKVLAPKAALMLQCVDAAMPAPGMGRIREVLLEGPGISVRLLRPEGVGVAIEIEGVAAKAVFPKLDTAALLREELGIFSRDDHYEQSLAAARELLQEAA